MNNTRNKKPKERILNFVISFVFIYQVFSLNFIYSDDKQEKEIRVIKENAELRLLPDNESLIIKNLPLGSIFTIEEISDEWIKIKLPPNQDGIIVTGYIHQRFIEESTKEAPEVTKITEKKKPIIIPIPQPEEPIPTKKERFSRFYLGGGAGYSIPAKEEYQSGIYFRGILGFCITKNIALQIGIIHTQSNTVSSQEGLSKGKLSIIPVLLSLKFRFPIKQLFIPYIGIGGNYSFNKFSIATDTVSAWNKLGFNIIENVENAIGFSIDAGLDYLITKNVALNIELNYFNVKIEGNWIIEDQITDIEESGNLKNSSLNTVFIGGGLRIYF